MMVLADPTCLPRDRAKTVLAIVLALVINQTCHENGLSNNTNTKGRRA